jgi:hypothetical protein
MQSGLGWTVTGGLSNLRMTQQCRSGVSGTTSASVVTSLRDYVYNLFGPEYIRESVLYRIWEDHWGPSACDLVKSPPLYNVHV